VALSRLYVWGSVNKSGVVSVKKRPASRTEAFQFTSVCMLFAHFPWTNGIKIYLSCSNYIKFYAASQYYIDVSC